MLRIVATCLLLLFPAIAHASPSIDWRVKHPFRYFTETTDFDMQREAMADVMASNGGVLTANAVSDLERLLNDPRWLREWYKQDANLYPDAKRSGRPEGGWANPINLRKATCWDSHEQWHSSCASDSFGSARRTDYVLPQAHTVVFDVKDPPPGSCRWQAARPIFIQGKSSLVAEIDKPCDADVETRIPFEPEVPEAARGVAVSVVLPDLTKLSQAPVWVRDRLIVGIGDSFSSGEGNPDTPVELDKGSVRAGLNMAFVYDSASQKIKYAKSYSLPVRSQNSPAGWLDRKCHRSAYSHQLRTALQVALADTRHSAVTFLGYGCSGAEVTEGLLMPWGGVEAVDSGYFTGGGSKRRDMPQVDRLMTELCRDDLSNAGATRTIALDQPVTNPKGKPVNKLTLLNCKAGRFLRPIDLLMISIGGNDVGFTPLIADILTAKPPPYADDNSRSRAKQVGAPLVGIVARITKSHDVKRARERALELPARFAALRKALAPLPIASTVSGKPNIILTAFPKVEFDQDGKLCGQTPRERLDGLNVGGVLAIDVPTLRLVSDFVNNTLYPATRAAAQAGSWYFVDEHRAAFATHGVCAQKRISEDSATAAENMMLPYYHFASPHNVWSDFDPFSANREANFNPLRDTRPYAPRQRWFRTLNDICLFVQYKAKGSPPPPASWGLANLIEACLGGPFHPTAEGQSHMADAAYAKAKAILNLPEPVVADLRSH